MANKRNKRKARKFIDARTGEEMLGLFSPEQRHYEQFTMVFCIPLLTLLVNEGRRHEDDTALRPVHWRLLWWVIASTGYENQLTGYVSDIARQLGNDRSTISKAIDVLKDRGLIRTFREGAGRPLTIRVHPALCFRGKARQRAAVLDEYWSDAPHPPLLGGWTPAPGTEADPQWDAPPDPS